MTVVGDSDTHHVAGVGRGAVADQLVDDVVMAHEGSDVDGSQTRLQGGSVDRVSTAPPSGCHRLHSTTGCSEY